MFYTCTSLAVHMLPPLALHMLFTCSSHAFCRSSGIHDNRKNAPVKSGR